MTLFLSPPPFAMIATFFVLSLLALSTTAQVPANETFTFVNFGHEFSDHIAEYGASFRIIQTDTLSFYTFPFRLCFYNTTPNAFVFAIRVGIPRDEDLMRWVWDANRKNPAGENSTLSFGRDGNLLLAEADGRVVWQTNTANKGVTGMRLLPNGNLVLHDRKGKFIWQSFDHPVDTLLVGQSFYRRNGRNTLVSRKSSADASDGDYRLVFESSGVNLYLRNSGQFISYNGWRGVTGISISFDAVPAEDVGPAYELVLDMKQDGGTNWRIDLRRINYNATISFLRLESDGNIKVYTYFDRVRELRWEETFAFFSSHYVRECGLPFKCGAFGLCQSGMCVACPTPKGLLGWSENCAPPRLGSCKANEKINYFKIANSEHFLRPFQEDGEGPIKIEQCREKCSKDCNCKGFVYKDDSSKCLLAPMLGTIIRGISNSTVYIKY